VTPERGLLHHDESRSLQVLHKPLGEDLRHELVGVVDALAALEAQGEGQRAGDVLGSGGCKAIGRNVICAKPMAGVRH
jgi:hypothetical protein